MEKNGHPNLKVTQAGFVVHETKGWLGASPNGWVMDPSYEPSNGMLEIKCPYTKADNKPEEMSKDEWSYFHLVDGIWQLDKK